MTKELKSCPFCGGEAKCIEYYGLYHVVCCDCYTTGRDCPSIETACKAWNSRPIENELHKKIEKLEAENTRLREALEFYANTDVYEYYDKYESTAIQNEGGQKAREALKELLK